MPFWRELKVREGAFGEAGSDVGRVGGWHVGMWGMGMGEDEGEEEVEGDGW
jgi:hypothetical protein